MKRINIVGCAGAGKSTFGEKLGDKLQIPVIEIDQLFWKPNWQETSDEGMKSALQFQLSKEEWILVGNYNRFEKIKWEKVETVIWIDLSYWRVFWQVTFRSLRRAFSSKEIWPGTGCKESFYKTFFTKDSIILWMMTSYENVKRRYIAYSRSPKYSHIQWVRLKSHKKAQEYLDSLEVNKRED